MGGGGGGGGEGGRRGLHCLRVSFGLPPSKNKSIDEILINVSMYIVQ